MEIANATVTDTQVDAWVNRKTDEDGFAALHFSSFRVNIDLIKLLLKNGANMH